MSVARSKEAIAALKALLDQPQPDRAYIATTPLPAGFRSAWPEPWLWGAADDQPTGDGESVVSGPQLPPLRTPAAYELTDATEASGLHRPPLEAIAGTSGPFSEAQHRYCRASIDVTMRGGTTSGVVYPMAICELARWFRLRNIGGASAGAIAAGLAAAAELGRARWDLAGRPELPDLAAERRNQGDVRQGFVGVADATAWFAQVDVDGPDQFRVAQLFRPTAAARPLYRLAVAVMRRNWLGFGSLLLWSFGLISRLITAVILVGAPMLLAYRSTGDGVWSSVLAAMSGPYWWAVLWLATMTVSAVGLIVAVGAFSAWVSPPKAPAAELAEPIVPPPGRDSPLPWLLGLLAFGVGLVGLVLCSTSGTWAGLGGWRVAAVWLVLVVALFAVQVLSLLRVLLTAKQQRFGLVSGSVGAETYRPGGRGFLWDRIAGLAPPTFDEALIPWLTRLTSQLAGQAEVLRFGHLWLGDEYRPPGPERSEDVLQRLRLASSQPAARLVNLELMTTELVHGVPYRFPLDPDDQSRAGLSAGQRAPTLFIRIDDFRQAGAEMFPRPVLDALCDAAQPVTAYDIESGKPIDGLRPLPEPWDLPVIFATRMSLALPALFQAVPMYRLVSGAEDDPHLIRDDYGARISRDGSDITYPAGRGRMWVEELWFSDGGITSNFPIHLFDSPLPLWPTIGINLGGHPNGHQHQDVWLPTDSQARTSPPTPQKGSMFGFAAAIVSTARGWADTSQTFMPAFRGRVAWVRQRRSEGGTNLFMTKQTVASLALRGAVAGARLARRFGSDAHWERHQWLRLRVAMGNLAALRRQLSTAVRSPLYSGLLADPASRTIAEIRTALQQVGGDANPALDTPKQADGALNWYLFEPEPDYWTAARDLAETFTLAPPSAAGSGADPLSDGVPKPAPVIRLVPPV
jgi:predicted acylesterase/phospholipase RssA